MFPLPCQEKIRPSGALSTDILDTFVNPEGEPKYKLPPKFQKHLVLYNFHRAKEFASEHGLILVEGFFDTMKLWQAGFKNVVALMGTMMSNEQADLLIEALAPDGKLTLMLDPDEPGIKATRECTIRRHIGEICAS